MNMLITVGENTARECGITREESDHWSYHSNLRAIAATDDGRFAEEIVPVPCRPGEARRSRSASTSTPPRHLAREAGVAAVAHRPRRPGHRPATPRASPTVAPHSSWSPGATPRRTGWSRWPPSGRGTRAGSSRLARAWRRRSACPAPWTKAGLSESDVDLVEINEAFATMAVACSRKLGFSHDIVNVNGGAVGIGHPIAASGARILVTLIHELRRRGGGIGVGTLCAGGGMGSATVLEVHPAA